MIDKLPEIQIHSCAKINEKLNEDAEQVAADIKEIYKEALAQGFDTKAIKKCIALRKKDKDELEEEDEVLKLYRSALGL